MTDLPDAYEQLMLELINRARLDPSGEFSRLINDPASRTGATPQITSALQYYNVDMAALQQALSGMSAASALAWNDTLSTTATAHSQQMIAYDTQAHILPGEVDPGSRALAAGYSFNTLGENVFAYGQDALYSHAAFMIDWGGGPTGMQDPAGHRINIMNPNAQDIGIGVIAENNPSTSVGSQVITEDIGSRFGYQAQLLGVVINDVNQDHFYGIGEGLGGVTITATGAAGTYSTTTWDAGGYQMVLPTGSYSVHFVGAGVDWTTSIVMGTSNLKLDAESGLSTTTVTPVDTSPVDTGGSTTKTEGIFYDAPMTQWVAGFGSHDVFVIDDLASSYQNAWAADGSGVVVWKGDKFDILSGVETLRFIDRDVTAGSNGLFSLTAATGGQDSQAVMYDAPMTQWLNGSTANDIFVIDDVASAYSDARTQDGTGIVLWKGEKFDVLSGFDTLRFLDRDVKVGSDGLFDLTSTSGGQASQAVQYDAPMTQWLTGSTNNDVFVIDDISSVYSNARTLDGSGVVLWKGDKFDVLTGFDTLRFLDRDVKAGSDGLFDLSSTGNSGGTGEAFFQNAAGTQWLYGTGNNDVFVVNASSQNYGAARTQDGTGIVVWNGNDFDILNGFETIRFTDHDMSVAGIA